MDNAPISLDGTRLRWALAGLIGLVVAAIAFLRPPSHNGLVVYAAGESAPVVIAAFSRTTGIPVTLIRLSTGPLLARIAAEGTRPGWTLAWFDGDMPAAGLDAAGLLAHGTTPPAQWNSLGRSLVPANGAWTPVAVSIADMTVTRGVSRAASAVLGMADPALSGAAYLQVAALLNETGGWPRGCAAVQRLSARGLSVAPTSPNVVVLLREGRIGRALLQSNTAYLLASRDAEFRVSVPRVAYVLPSVVVESAGTTGQRRVDADRFLRFMTAAETQSERLTSGRVDAYAWPTVATRATVPAILPPLAALHLAHLDTNLWGARQAAITDWFEQQVAGR